MGNKLAADRQRARRAIGLIWAAADRKSTVDTVDGRRRARREIDVVLGPNRP
jgi:hypothetical protein